MKRADIVLIGGGVAGLSTAWHLARRGIDGVVLLEREVTLGAHSSGRNAAILRTLTESALATELALESARFLAAPPAGFAEERLVDPCGLVLLLAAPPPPGLAAWMRRKPAGSVREIAKSELRALAPGYAGELARALHVRDEGRIDVAALLQGFAAGARRAGVEIRTGAHVRELVCEGGAVRGVILADGTEIAAERVALAAGGWAGELGRRAGSRLALRPTRRHLLVTAPDARIDPRGPVIWSDPDAFYARPESGGMLLCACDQSDVQPDRCTTDEAVRVAIAEKSARLLPMLASAGAAHFWAGLRTFAADGEFLIGPDPDVTGLFWIAALGGHGMTCAPAIGRIGAAALLGEAEGDPLAAALSPARFARPRTAGAHPL